MYCRATAFAAHNHYNPGARTRRPHGMDTCGHKWTDRDISWTRDPKAASTALKRALSRGRVRYCERLGSPTMKWRNTQES